jgi:myo-inositol-1(or 4)-monophosphatase
MDTDVATLESVLADALPIAREAGALLREGWRTAFTTRSKAPGDLVTELDLKSEALIRERLAARFPDHAFVGEESGASGAGELAWHVDPIDGTSNFAHGHPFFCVAMGLSLRGEPVVGIVHAPALDLEWTAVRGGGARRCEPTRGGGASAPCRVSSASKLEDALLATGFPAWRASRPDNNYRSFLAIDSSSHGVRRCGAAAIEIAMVSDGAYDGFWDLGLRSWDVCASALIVREAGGTVTSIDGSPFRLDGREIVATNGRLHGELLMRIAAPTELPPGITGSTVRPNALRTEEEMR